MATDVTLDDVARKSGVSRATASRALNGRDGVKDEVRERVQLIAAALDYRPNRAAQNLAGGRASVIGLVLGSDELRLDIYAASLLQAVARAADSHDQGLMLLMDAAQPNVAVRNLLSDGLVDGVIVSAVAVGDRWVEQLLDARVPTVLVGAHPRRSDVHVVDTENVASSSAIVGRMLDAGCRRLATLTGPLDRVDASQRLEGFRLAHRERGLGVDESLIFIGDFSRSKGFDQAPAILEAGADGVFAANDEMALGVLRHVHEAGLKVPGDLMLGGFDGTSQFDPSSIELASVEQPFSALARTAVRGLVELIDGADVPLVQLVEPSQIEGATIGLSADQAQ